jgi:hypothetical protein
MASTYSPLKIELISTGDQSGAWGNTTNTNLGTALEEAIVGRATADFPSDANLTLTLTNTNVSQVARHFVLNVTSSVSLTVTRDLVVPAIEKPYIVQNNTTGGQSIRVIVAGASVTVPNGRTAFVYNDGTDIKAAFDYIPALTVPTLNAGTLTATADSAFTSTGALTISVGTTAQRPAAAVGKIRWNTTLNQYEGYDGTNWTLLGGAVISNDTSTSSNVFPVFAGVTSGNVSTLFTGNAKLLYKPSTGELQSTALVASNGLVVNSATVSENYTIPTGSNAMSAGPVTINGGVAVTVPSGSVWTVI